MKKRGRKRYCYPLEEAMRRVRDECISSVLEYKNWHKLHKPAKMPARPDRAYKNCGFTTWADFLGSNNDKFQFVPKNYLSYEDAKEFTHSLGLKSREEWLAYCKSGNKPDDIPFRPEIYYRKKGTWYTWTEFLGSRKLKNQLDTLQKFISVILVIKPNNTPMNVFQFRQVQAPLAQIRKIIKEENIQVIKVFKSGQFDWLRFLNSKFTYYYGMEQIYMIPNINEIFYIFNNNLESYKLY